MRETPAEEGAFYLGGLKIPGGRRQGKGVALEARQGSRMAPRAGRAGSQHCTLAGCGPPVVCLWSWGLAGACPADLPFLPNLSLISRALGVGPLRECPMCQVLSCRG